MPKVRIFGNAVLSLWSKISSGYWSITDPTNGFTAIHRKALSAIHLDKLRKSYFFESDLLFRLEHHKRRGRGRSDGGCLRGREESI